MGSRLYQIIVLIGSVVWKECSIDEGVRASGSTQLPAGLKSILQMQQGCNQDILYYSTKWGFTDSETKKRKFNAMPVASMMSTKYICIKTSSNSFIEKKRNCLWNVSRIKNTMFLDDETWLNIQFSVFFCQDSLIWLFSSRRISFFGQA